MIWKLKSKLNDTTIMNKWFDHTKNMKNDEKNLSTNYDWNFQKKNLMWEFDILYSFNLSWFACCMMINQNNDHELDCFHINIKKIMFEWHTDKNQILWFISLFAYVVTLWFYLQLIEHKLFNNTTSQMISYWIEIRRTIFFFMKNLVWWIWMLDCSITTKRNFQKKYL